MYMYIEGSNGKPTHSKNKIKCVKHKIRPGGGEGLPAPSVMQPHYYNIEVMR